MRRHFVVLAAAACLATTACTNPSDTPTPVETSTTVTDSAEPTPTHESSNDTPTPAPTQSSTSAETAGSDATAEDVDLADQSFSVTAQQAIDTAVAEAGGGFVHSIELDWSRRNSAWVYELDVLAGAIDHDVDVHADTGEILEHEQEDTDDKEQAISLDSPMTWETARDKALGAVQGRITSWKLEWDDDYTAYEFDIEGADGDETEVEVRVDTGAVTIDD